MVTVKRTATFTRVPAFAELLLDDHATAATDLAGILGVHEQDVPASVRSFVGTELLEQAPTSIDNTLVDSAFGRRPIGQVGPVFILLWLGALAHIGRLQLLKDNRSVGIDQLPALLVQKITPLVANLPMGLCHLFDRFISLPLEAEGFTARFNNS